MEEGAPVTTIDERVAALKEVEDGYATSDAALADIFEGNQELITRACEATRACNVQVAALVSDAYPRCVMRVNGVPLDIDKLDDLFKLLEEHSSEYIAVRIPDIIIPLWVPLLHYKKFTLLKTWFDGPEYAGVIMVNRVVAAPDPRRVYASRMVGHLWLMVKTPTQWLFIRRDQGKPRICRNARKADENIDWEKRTLEVFDGYILDGELFHEALNRICTDVLGITDEEIRSECQLAQIYSDFMQPPHAFDVGEFSVLNVLVISDEFANKLTEMKHEGYTVESMSADALMAIYKPIEERTDADPSLAQQPFSMLSYLVIGQALKIITEEARKIAEEKRQAKKQV